MKKVFFHVWSVSNSFFNGAGITFTYRFDIIQIIFVKIGIVRNMRSRGNFIKARLTVWLCINQNTVAVGNDGFNSVKAGW